MVAIRHFFMNDNNPSNPSSKLELLKTIVNVRVHKTFINDKNISITKKYEKYKNVPPSVRITTVCCLVAREIVGRTKSIFAIEMFMSEIAFVSKEIFQKHFCFMGTLFKSYFIEEIVEIMQRAKPTWPNLDDNTYDTNVCPEFNIDFEKKKQPSDTISEQPLDDLVHFIDGCAASTPVNKPRKATKKKIKNKVDSFDPIAASEFLRQRWMEALE